MAIETVKYIRKPLYVDAVRITAANFDEVAAWCQGEVLQDEVPGKGTTKKYIKVRVHNPKNARQTKAFVGDWLLYTERGYKVYTNKAFHASFDEVVNEVPVNLEAAGQGIVTSTRELAPGITLTQAVQQLRSAPPSTLDQIRQLESTGQTDEQIAEQLGLDVNVIRVIKQDGRELEQETTVRGHVVDQPERVLPESAAMQTARELIESEGGTVEPATPEAIADVVNEQQPVVQGRIQGRVVEQELVEHVGDVELADMTPRKMPVPLDADNVEDVPAQDKIVPAAAEGKRVLSIAEQKEMTAEEVQELIRSGEAVLAQDLPEA